MLRGVARLINSFILWTAGLLLLIASTGLAVRAYLQHLAADELAIRSPNGVQEGLYVTIGGIEQWVQIRGEDRNNPVLLFVHGGPGSSTLPMSSGWRSWERHFTIVQWDQRGTGRTWSRTGDAVAPTMTLEQMTQDGVELAEYLRAHLHKHRIGLIGHSWGSFLGVHIVKRRPDLFFAYVGTGQVVGRATFETAFELAVARLQAQARSANNADALAELAPIAADPAVNEQNHLVTEKWRKALALPPDDSFEPVGPVSPPFMPEYSLLDWYYWNRGTALSERLLRGVHGPMFQRDLPSLGFEFPMRVLFVEGDQDYVTPYQPAERYFEQIEAPDKDFVLIQGGDHFIPFDRPDEFLAALVTRVRPFADSPPS